MEVGGGGNRRRGTEPAKSAGSDRCLSDGLEAMDGWERCPAGDCGSTSAVFDRSVLDDLASMLDVEELDAYLALLEPTVAPRIEKLFSDLDEGNLVGLLETAHALTGGAACYGLTALSEAARTIEQGARAAPRAVQLELLRQAVAAAAGLLDSSLVAVRRWRCRVEYDRASTLDAPFTV